MRLCPTRFPQQVPQKSCESSEVRRGDRLHVRHTGRHQAVHLRNKSPAQGERTHQCVLWVRSDQIGQFVRAVLHHPLMFDTREMDTSNVTVGVQCGLNS